MTKPTIRNMPPGFDAFARAPRPLSASETMGLFPDALRRTMSGRDPLLPPKPGGHNSDEVNAAIARMDEIIGPLSPIDRARTCLELGAEIFGGSIEAHGLMLGAATEICEHHTGTYFPKDVQNADLARVVHFLHQNLDTEDTLDATMGQALNEAIRAGGRRGLKLLFRQLKRSMRTVARDDLMQSKLEAVRDSTDDGSPAYAALRQHLRGEAPPLHSDTAIPGDTVGAKVRGYLDAAKRAGDPMSPEEATIAAAVYGELAAMYQAPRLEKAQDTKFHKLVTAIKEKSILVPVSAQTQKLLEDVPRDVLGAPLDGVQVFIIKHDWARAFDRAKDFDGGEIRMPADLAAFEMQLNGRHVIAFITAKDGQPHLLTPFIQTSMGWALVAGAHYDHGKWDYTDPVPVWGPNMAPIPLTVPDFIGAQIKAICVALEAELAETEVIRAPHKLNQKRERQGKIPIFDYHIVDLSKRKRLAPAAPELLDPDRDIHHRRMHFVRGHWRHYEARKTWIRWHLRGNPDLGYIDKEYRL